MPALIARLASWFASRRLARLRRLIPARGGILRRERGQAVLRIVVSTVVVLYLVATSETVIADRGVPLWLVIGVGYVVLAVALLAHILRSDTSPAARRYLSNLADIAAISYSMHVAGESGLPLFLLYLWVTLGSGFRFGSRALLVSAVLSSAGFAIVELTTPAWQTNATLTTSVALALFILPVYAAHLVHQLNNALARAEEASAAKGQFLARMSHELRTPLNGILGATELLSASRRLTPEERSLLDVIRDSVSVSLRQIGNVLDFSKIEAGKLAVESADFDLHELVITTADMVRPTAVQKGLRFLVRIAPETPFRLVGDAHHLRTVLLNLLSNAVKFTERGQVCLDVAPRADSGREVRLRFEVHDTGIGVSPEARHRIFESFTQEDVSTTRRYGGTGLGTTIAKQLVELMGGEIGISSARNSGSLFWFEIPLAKQPPAVDADAQLPGVRAVLLSQDAAVTGHFTRAVNALQGKLVVVADTEEAVALLARGIRLGNPMHAMFVDAALALALGSAHRAGAVCDKAMTANVPVILVTDIAPATEQLRRWGYSAVLARAPAQAAVFASLHATPVRREASSDGVVGVAPWLWGRRPETRPRILVADDNRTNLMIVCRILEQAGYPTHAVDKGDEALESLCGGGYRLAILDMHMPGLDGISLIRQYRLRRPRSRLPILMLTANVSLEAQLECADAGADAYLAKPVKAADLRGEVERLLRDADVTVLPRPGSDDQERAAEGPVVLDTTVLAELDRLYHDPHELAKVIGEYEHEGTALLLKISEAAARGNHPAFCDHVHALKGNAANVGAMRLMEVCRQAEATGIVEFRGTRQSLVNGIQGAFDEALAALRALLAGADKGSPEKPDRSPGEA